MERRPELGKQMRRRAFTLLQLRLFCNADAECGERGGERAIWLDDGHRRRRRMREIYDSIGAREREREIEEGKKERKRDRERYSVENERKRKKEREREPHF
jgi:hypothetical protein